jgi:rare lipoprotein A
MPSGHPGSRVVSASWYGPGFEGRRTASGEAFHQDELTAASRTLPLGSHVTITNPANGHSVVVKVNDRGPYVRGRSIDISRATAARLGITRQGVARVEISRVDGLRRAEPVFAPAPEPETSYGDLGGISKRQIRKWHLSAVPHRHYYPQRSRKYRAKIVSDAIGSWLASALPRF